MTTKRWISPVLAIFGVLIAVWAGMNLEKFIVAKLIAAGILIAAMVVRGSYSSSRKEN